MFKLGQVDGVKVNDGSPSLPPLPELPDLSIQSVNVATIPSQTSPSISTITRMNNDSLNVIKEADTNTPAMTNSLTNNVSEQTINNAKAEVNKVTEKPLPPLTPDDGKKINEILREEDEKLNNVKRSQCYNKPYPECEACGYSDETIDINSSTRSIASKVEQLEQYRSNSLFTVDDATNTLGNLCPGRLREITAEHLPEGWKKLSVVSSIGLMSAKAITGNVGTMAAILNTAKGDPLSLATDLAETITNNLPDDFSITDTLSGAIDNIGIDKILGSSSVTAITEDETIKKLGSFVAEVHDARKLGSFNGINTGIISGATNISEASVKQTAAIASLHTPVNTNKFKLPSNGNFRKIRPAIDKVAMI